MIYALDSNIVSYDLKGLFDIRKKLETVVQNGNSFVIPPITFYEVLRGLKVKNAGKTLEKFNQTFLPYLQDTLSSKDWFIASDIYAECIKSGHPIADDDLFQAAFCIRHGYTLVTHNTKHFEYISGLQFVDWV
jgi:tRNA(fMet)-specific endonuclease VapC